MKLGICQQKDISQEVLDLIDYLEIKTLDVSNIKKFIALKKPYLFHFSNSLKKLLFASDEELLNLLRNDDIKTLINKSPFPWISLHLGLAVNSYVFDKNNDPIATEKPIPEKELLDKVGNNLQIMKKLFPAKKILLETSPYLPFRISKGAHLYICEPEFINKVIEVNNCGFLLDLGHTIVSAYNLGYAKPEDYWQELPLEKTVEIHLHKPRFSKEEGLWRDAHLPITDQEIKYLQFILKRAKNVKAITLEASGLHPDKILINELKMLRKLLQ